MPPRPVLAPGPAGAGAFASEADPLDLDAPPGRAWTGAGGRWRLWPLRMALWAALLVIAYRGVTAIVFNPAGALRAGGTSSAGATAGQFPVALAEAYASEFGQVYLNFSPVIQAQREQELAAFVPASIAAANPDLGWDGAGQMTLQSEQVAGIAVQDRQHAVVTLLATVNGQLMELGVPVIASAGSVVVAGEPAWLPAPRQVPPPTQPGGRSDPVAQGELMKELPAFFAAYANGDSAELSRFAAPGVSLTGLGGAVAFDSIAGVHVPPGGAMRQITVTVIWQVPSQGSPGIAKIAMTYRVSVLALQSGKWDLKEINASTEAVGAK
ncbi:MAG: conjugal transfer protein [Streptosporangiaceae bacterium]